MDTIKTGNKCNCGGTIVVRTDIPYVPRHDPNAIGPGSENTATEADRRVVGAHCSLCGAEYRDIGQFEAAKQYVREAARKAGDKPTPLQIDGAARKVLGSLRLSPNTR